MRRVLLTALLAAAAAPLAAQTREAPSAPAGARPDRPVAESNAERQKAAAEAGYANAPVAEAEARSRGSVAVGGRTIPYTATAGTLTIRDTEGKPTASIFYTAYTADGGRDAGKATAGAGRGRPVTFFYNGGPGSPSFWLRMGSFGPVRLRTANPEFIRPAPYAVGPNPDTLLDKTDLVFIDAVGTGYSRPLGDAKPQQFYGVDEDADAFARAILRWVTKYGRWNSPKFLFGESYGTTRSGALAYQLQDRGMALNGVVLLSSIMNYGSRQPGMDRVYLDYLPSYAATAAYHGKAAAADPAAAAAAARAFALGPYATALAKGQALPAAEEDAVARRMSELTGLSVDFLKRSDLRVDLPRFQKELLRDRRLTVGRFDARYTGVDTDAAGDAPETDASSDAISGAFIASFQDYLANDLGYKTDLPYRLSARDAPGWTWNWAHRSPVRGYGGQQTTPNTAVDLAAAMRANPYLKVLSLNGWYDMATPFFGTETDLGHMMLERGAAQANLSFRYYPAGHMVYLNPAALHQMKADLAAWYDEAVSEARRQTPPAAPAMSAGGGVPN